MSWSFNAIGKPAAVIDKMKLDFSAYQCAEPEESIRQGVMALLDKSLSAMLPSSAVQINASGSQSAHTDGSFSNSLNVSVQPIYGFVE